MGPLGILVLTGQAARIISQRSDERDDETREKMYHGHNCIKLERRVCQLQQFIL